MAIALVEAVEVEKMEVKAKMPICVICFEEMQRSRWELAALHTKNGDVLRRSDCGHDVCLGCLASWVKSRVDEQRVFRVCCPMVGCKNEIFEQDLQSMVHAGVLPEDVLLRFADLRSRDYSARAAALLDERDFELLRRLARSRRCPRCNVLLERSSGCNSFYCICGHHFQYDKAPTALGNGMRKYTRVINLAESCDLSLSEAEQLLGRGKVYYKGSKIFKTLGISLEEAADLFKRAAAFDGAAAAIIAQARRGAKLGSTEELSVSGAPAAAVPEAEGAPAGE